MSEIEKPEEPWIDLGVAARMTRFLARIAVVEDVYVFGSVARNRPGKLGKDLDMITTVPGPVADTFINEVWNIWNRKGYRAPQDVTRGLLPGVRWEAARTVLAFTQAEFDNYVAAQGWPHGLKQLDILALPADWLDRLSELQLRLPYDNPEFMHNIGGDARLYDPIRGTFAPPTLL